MFTQLCSTLCDPMDYIAHQTSLSMEFSRQEYWSGLPFPPPRDLPDSGIEPCFLSFLHWQADSLPAEPQGSPYCEYIFIRESVLFLPHGVGYSKLIYTHKANHIGLAHMLSCKLDPIFRHFR